LEFLKDYDINFQYYPGKANVVADALCRRSYLTLNILLVLPRDLCEDFKKLELNMVTMESRPILHTLEVQPTLIEEIRAVKSKDPQLDRMKTEVSEGKAPRFVIHEVGY